MQFNILMQRIMMYFFGLSAYTKQQFFTPVLLEYSASCAMCEVSGVPSNSLYFVSKNYDWYFVIANENIKF